MVNLNRLKRITIMVGPLHCQSFDWALDGESVLSVITVVGLYLLEFVQEVALQQFKLLFDESSSFEALFLCGHDSFHFLQLSLHCIYSFVLKLFFTVWPFLISMILFFFIFFSTSLLLFRSLRPFRYSRTLTHRFTLKSIQIFRPFYFLPFLFTFPILLFLCLLIMNSYSDADLSLNAEIEVSLILFFYDFGCDQPYSDGQHSVC